MVNIDCNVILYAFTHNEVYGTKAEAIIERGGRIDTNVIAEVLYYVSSELIWSVQSQFGRKPTVTEKDARFASVIVCLEKQIGRRILVPDDPEVTVFALDLVRYQRLDWVDSYLIAQNVIRGIQFYTFDGKMNRVVREVESAGNRIPVVLDYTGDTDNLPAHVFSRKVEKGKKMHSGLSEMKVKGEEDDV